MSLPCIESIQDCGWNYSQSIALAGLIVALLGVVVNAAVAWWIVRAVQNSLQNRRILKDHFIKEILAIRERYDSFLAKLLQGQLRPREVLSWFQDINIRLDALLTFVTMKYNMDKATLRAYQIDLRDMITEDPTYISAFKRNILLKPKAELTRKVRDFQAQNTHLFNEVIIQINDA